VLDCMSIDEDELQWPPNPYQAQADAQVQAGAWPGANLLMHAGTYCDSAQQIQPMQPMQQLVPVMHVQQVQNVLPIYEDVVTEERQQDLVNHPAAASTEDIISEASQSEPFAMTEPCKPSVDAHGFTYEEEDTSWKGSSWGFLFEFNASDNSGNCSTQSDDEGDIDSDKPCTSASTAETTDCESTGTLTSESQSSVKLSHKSVPKHTDLQKEFGDEVDPDEILTLMIRNIPHMYTRSMLMEELDALGFREDYDFIYLPMDKTTHWNVGYAFVNFLSSSVAKKCMSMLENYSFKRFEHGTGKVAQVCTAHIQGLKKNLQYYSTTAVQHSRVQSHRPLALEADRDGVSNSTRRPHRQRRGRRRREETPS